MASNRVEIWFFLCFLMRTFQTIMRMWNIRLMGVPLKPCGKRSVQKFIMTTDFACITKRLKMTFLVNITLSYSWNIKLLVRSIHLFKGMYPVLKLPRSTRCRLLISLSLSYPTPLFVSLSLSLLHRSKRIRWPTALQWWSGLSGRPLC